jgi:hypothetical protein
MIETNALSAGGRQKMPPGCIARNNQTEKADGEKAVGLLFLTRILLYAIIYL